MKLPRQADPRRLEHLANLIRNYVNDQVDFGKLSKNISILEIGSFAGESALYMAQALNSMKIFAQILCIDPWEPYFSQQDKNKSEHYKYMERVLKSGEVYNHFLTVIREFNQKSGFVSIRHIKDKFCNLELFEKGFDIIYIDGSHYYSDVYEDIKKAKGLIYSNGIICGDDLEYQFDQVNKLTCESHANNTDCLGNYHPGVTLAVWKHFGRVKSKDGFWWIPADEIKK